MSMLLLALAGGAAALFLAKGKSGGGRTPAARRPRDASQPWSPAARRPRDASQPWSPGARKPARVGGPRPEEFNGGVKRTIKHGPKPSSSTLRQTASPAQPAQLVTRSTNAPGAATVVPPAVPLSDPNTGEPITYVKGVSGPAVLEYGEASVNMRFDGTARDKQPIIQVDARGVVTVLGGFATHNLPGVGRISQGGDKGHEGVNIAADDALEVIRAQAYQAAAGTPTQRAKVAAQAVNIARQIKMELELGMDPQTLAAMEDAEARRQAEAAQKEAERRRKAAEAEARRRRQAAEAEARRRAAAQDDDDDDDDDLSEEAMEELEDQVREAEAEAAGQGHRGDAALEEDLF